MSRMLKNQQISHFRVDTDKHIPAWFVTCYESLKHFWCGLFPKRIVNLSWSLLFVSMGLWCPVLQITMLLGKAAVVCAYVQRVSVSGRVVCAVKLFFICMCFFFSFAARWALWATIHNSFRDSFPLSAEERWCSLMRNWEKRDRFPVNTVKAQDVGGLIADFPHFILGCGGVFSSLTSSSSLIQFQFDGWLSSNNNVF